MFGEPQYCMLKVYVTEPYTKRAAIKMVELVAKRYNDIKGAQAFAAMVYQLTYKISFYGRPSEDETAARSLAMKPDESWPQLNSINTYVTRLILRFIEDYLIYHFNVVVGTPKKFRENSYREGPFQKAEDCWLEMNVAATKSAHDDQPLIEYYLLAHACMVSSGFGQFWEEAQEKHKQL